MATVDLHMHSNFSNDGEFSPGELVSLCLEAGLTHAAIADHNSVKAVKCAQEAALGTGLAMIPAVEMNCAMNGTDLHLLGYGVDITDPIFHQIEVDLHKQEHENSALLMHLVRQLGIEFEDEMIESLAFDGVVTGEMIAEAALVYDREAKNPLLDPYRGDGKRSDNPYVNFYWDYCDQGKPAHTPMDYMPLSQAVEIITANQGVPVLAHPGVQVREDPALLTAIIAEGVVGLEVFSSYHSQEQVGFYRQAAETHRLLMTCGSDFHGKTKPSITIGSIDCDGQEQRIVDGLLARMPAFP